MKKSKHLAILLASSALLLTACGKGELEATIISQQEIISELESTIENGVTVHDTGGSSLQEIEGASSDVMKYVEDKFVFPTALKIENTTEDYNNTAIRLGSEFEITPSNNWITKVDGVQLKLNHPLGIIGTVKALNTEDFDLYESGQDYKTLSASFVKGIPTSTIKYSNIYMDGDVAGALSTADVKMESEGNQSKLVTGLVHYADNALTFAFLLDSKDLTSAQEMVHLLLSSIAYSDSKVTIE